MKLKFNPKNLIAYVKISLIVLLAAIAVFVCAQAYSVLDDRLPDYISLVVCCAALIAVEAVNLFAIKSFAAKMVFFGFDSALLLAVCILTGDSVLSALYCIVLTGCYISVERFRDRTVLFGFSCGLYTASFVGGWVIRNAGLPLYSSVMQVLSGVLFGLLFMAVDYIVVQFLIKFYRTNAELRKALKEADESKAQLEEVFNQLTRTRVYEERNRIAKDIHDNAGHSMTTVIMQTEAAKLLIDDNPAEAKNRIISANIQARNALEQMRQSVHLLAGREQTRSLKEEVQEIIAQTIDGTDIKARYDMCEVQTDPDSFRFICNAVKELLANGIRHGGATAFYIELKQVFGEIQLIISDNGSGVSGEIEEGFGLKGMREKAEALGGKCMYTSEQGEGFEADITLPLKEKK